MELCASFIITAIYAGAVVLADIVAALEEIVKTLHTMSWGACSNGSPLLLSICQALAACTVPAGQLQVWPTS